MLRPEHRGSPRKYDEDTRAKFRRRYLTLRVLGYYDLTGIIDKLCAEFGVDRNAAHHLLRAEGLRI